MLTVDFGRLGLRKGELLLDLGCGGGRHAFEAFRLGARVVAADKSLAELMKVRDTLGAMVDAKEVSSGFEAAVVGSDALRLPFPDESFDRVIAAEILEHIPEDTDAMAELVRVLRPGGTMAVTVPRLWPEAVNWGLSREYHETEGGHVRIYRRSSLIGRLQGAGLEPFAQHHAHALHSPYWWLRCAVGVQKDDHFLVPPAYHGVLVWDITSAPKLTRWADRLLNPLIGKSLVVYLRKPAPAAVMAGFTRRHAGTPAGRQTVRLGRPA